MTDEQSPPPPPIQGSSKPKSKGKKQIFAGPKNQKNKIKAESIIDEEAPPLPISAMFNGFKPEVRGDIEVELDIEFPERFTSNIWMKMPVSSNVYFEGLPTAAPLTSKQRAFYALNLHTNLAAALKLLYSTPESKLGQTKEINCLKDRKIHVPLSFNLLLDLIGKTKYGSSNIRIHQNPKLIRNFLTKAIWNASQLQGYHNLIEEGDVMLDGLRRLSEMEQGELKNIIMPDRESLTQLQSEARNEMIRLCQQSTRYTLADESRIHVPYHPLKEQATNDDLLLYLETLNTVKPTDYLKIAKMAILSMMKRNWLDQYNDRFDQIDTIFVGTLIAIYTPKQVMTEAHLWYFGDFFANAETFSTLVDLCIEYSSESAIVLSNCFKMREMTRTQFGSPAQLAMIDEKTTKKWSHRNLPTFSVSKPKMDSTNIVSGRDVNLPGPITLAAAAMITKKVHYNEAFKGFTNTPMEEIANSNCRYSMNNTLSF